MNRFLLILLLLPAISNGANLKPSEDELVVINKSVDMVFADSFPEALAFVSSFNDTIPGQPMQHLLLASILHAQMMDREDYSREDEFMRHIGRASDALGDWVEKNPKDAWAYFFWGSAYGYKAVWQGQKGEWWKSLFSGLKAKSRFSDALKLDSTLYDSYTGLGNYHYWASVKLRKFLPFVSDNREDGLRELQLAMDSSLISSRAAGFGYSWALLNERKYSDALRVAYHLRDETSGGRTVLWLLGGIYWANGNLKKASEYYGMLAQSLEEAGNQNYYNLIYCRYRKGVCDYGLRDYKSAKNDFKALLAYNPPKDIRERHKKTFARAREYLDKIRAQGGE